MTNKMYSYIAISVTLTITLFTLCSSQGDANYYGKFIGSLKQYHHALQGDVYVVDSRTLHIRNFNYDGEGPAGYFYISNGKSPSDNGIKLRDERGSSGPLKRYRKKHITLTLPEGKTINNIKWFYVWCDEFAVNFGDVKIPKNLDFPKPQKIGKLSGVHGVSSDNIVIVDAQTLLIPAFSYDGEAPDAKFWVGTGTKPTPQGIRVPDENGKTEPLRKYDKKTIVLTLPSDITVFDIGHFAIWCEAFTVDFGHVEIPQDLTVPPSLKMLGVSPQKLSHFRLESPYSLYSALPELESDSEARSASKHAHIIKIRDTFDKSKRNNNSNSILSSNTNHSNSNHRESGDSLSNSSSAAASPLHFNCTHDNKLLPARTQQTERQQTSVNASNAVNADIVGQNETVNVTTETSPPPANVSRNNNTQQEQNYYTLIKYLQNETANATAATVTSNGSSVTPLPPPTEALGTNRTRIGQPLRTNKTEKTFPKSEQEKIAANMIEIIQSVSTEYEPLFDDSVFRNTMYPYSEYGPPRPTVRPSYTPSRNKKKNRNHHNQHPSHSSSRGAYPSKRAPVSWNVPAHQNRYNTYPELQAQSTTIVSKIIDPIDNGTSVRSGSPFRLAATTADDGYRTIGSSLTVGQISGDNFRIEKLERGADATNRFGAREPAAAASSNRVSNARRTAASTRRSTREKNDRPYRGDKKYRSTVEKLQKTTDTSATNGDDRVNDDLVSRHNYHQPSDDDNIAEDVILPGQILHAEDVLSLNSLESAAFLSSSPYDLSEAENETFEQLPALSP